MIQIQPYKAKRKRANTIVTHNSCRNWLTTKTRSLSLNLLPQRNNNKVSLLKCISNRTSQPNSNQEEVSLHFSVVVVRCILSIIVRSVFAFFIFPQKKKRNKIKFYTKYKNTVKSVCQCVVKSFQIATITKKERKRKQFQIQCKTQSKKEVCERIVFIRKSIKEIIIN